jgi:uncharacterized protein
MNCDCSTVDGVRSALLVRRSEIAEFCQNNHIIRMALFGSVLTDEFSPESDVDFLVEFHHDQVPGLLELVGMEIELSEILGGQKVDIRTAEDLSRYFRDKVVAEARVQYEAG